MCCARCDVNIYADFHDVLQLYSSNMFEGINGGTNTISLKKSIKRC